LGRTQGKLRGKWLPPGVNIERLGYGDQEDSGGIDSPAMQRVQAAQLHHQQKPPEYPGKAGIQQILSL
jgi:hypothetical protein